jgi:hypothetical protein
MTNSARCSACGRMTSDRITLCRRCEACDVKSPEAVERRFWSKVDRSRGPDACWLWAASRNQRGYGKFGMRDTMVRAHRFSWELANGPVPADLLVLHKCDVRHCVNPAHLFLGTAMDNTRDMIAKGRRRTPLNLPRGEAQHQSKLTTSDVLRMRRLFKSGVRLAELARMFGVTPTAAGYVCARRSWAHIPDEDLTPQGATP